MVNARYFTAREMPPPGEPTAADRAAVRTTAAAMLSRTAANDHRGAHQMGTMVFTRYGEAGVAVLMAASAEEIIQHAPASVRNPYARVQPELALTPDEFQVIVHRILSDWAGDSTRAPATEEQHYRAVAHYLTAVQRQDVDAVNQLVQLIGRQGHPTDFPVLYDTLRVIATRCSPLANAQDR